MSAAGNPLVAAPATSVSPFAGAFVLQGGQALVDAIHSGDWVDGGIAALSAGLDAVAAISDPLGTLIANGLGWLIDHLDPLKSWMDQLTGNAAEVAAFAQTWQNIGSRLHDSAELYRSRQSDLDGMSGATVDAYHAFAGDTVKHLDGAGEWASAVGTGLQVASELVQAVHDLVVQVLSQLVGSIISMAIEAACTLGFALPVIIEQVSTRAADLAEEVGSRLTRLLTSFTSLESILARLRGIFDDTAALFKDMLHGKGGDLDAAVPAGGRNITGIHGATSIADVKSWIGEVNPGYSRNSFDPRSSNCGTCSAAVFSRINGTDPEAVAGMNTLSTPEMESITGLHQVPSSPDKIRDLLVARGPGSHAVVGIDRMVGPGHWS